MATLEFLKSACYFIVILSILVIAHEWGHYIVAKLCKMRVDNFSLFFGPRLIRVGKWNGTEYNIRSVPLGGFVKIAGMEPEDLAGGNPIFKSANFDSGRSNPRKESAITREEYDKTLLGLSENALEEVNFANVSERIVQAVSDAVGDDSQLTPSGRENLEALLLTTGLTDDEHVYLEAILGVAQYKPDPHFFNQKPLWQRAAVIFAGPFMSLFFGYMLFCVMGFTTGLPDPLDHHVGVGNLIAGKPAELSGLKTGDWIAAVNGIPVNQTPDDKNDAIDMIHHSINPAGNAGIPLTLSVIRDNRPVTIVATPYIGEGEKFDAKGNIVKGPDGKPLKAPIGLLGFSADGVWKHYSPAGAVVQGTRLIKEQVKGTLQNIFSKKVAQNVGGPIIIAKVISDSSKQGIQHVAYLAAILSVSLGILNLFPIPILDGGHLMLLAWEGLRRRRLTSREVYSAQMIGLCIIGVLFVLVMYNDISNLITRH